ncbi:hypothetical protein WJX84_004134 [Apatococcus fuscideae]|uniref:Uncharacterized protein n=1 Tax=Apatococcus fuscideae TaxID=2026836 RepID=A0AAW1SW63_9CHLO
MASGAPPTRTAPEVPAATCAASVASDTQGQHGEGPVANDVILGRFAQASRCRNGRRDLGHEDVGSETSRAQIREARGELGQHPDLCYEAGRLPSVVCFVKTRVDVVVRRPPLT